jgi:hypothetical protein
MRDLDKALADIVVIRNHIAAGTTFRGYGPAAIAATGALAIITATAQTLWLDDANAKPLVFLAGWVATAVVAVAIIGAEMLGRSRRHHSGLANALIFNAIEQFLPAGIAGALLTAVLMQFAPEALWMLPGLWQVLVSLGIFASVRSMPRSIVFVGAWYFVAGFGTLMIASQHHMLLPWLMGVPFVIGQFLMAAMLHIAFGAADAED